MRTIPFVLISMCLSAACTSEPGRPYLGPAPSCQESCESDRDCAEGRLCCTNAALCGADHRCVQCVTTADCPTGSGCVLGFCSPGGCGSAADCKGSDAGPFCTPAGVCGACLSDANCKGNPAGERCSSLFVCACASDDDCTEPGLGLCRDEGCVCSDDSGCPNGAQKCELGVCIACAKDEQCGESKSKCIAPGTTAASCGCKDDSECGGETDTGPHCASDTGLCVTCLDDTQCAKDEQCLNPGTPDATCGCTKDAQCKGNPSGSFCNPGMGACQQCRAGSDCLALGLGSVCTPEGTCSCDGSQECTAKPSASKLEWVCE